MINKTSRRRREEDKFLLCYKFFLVTTENYIILKLKKKQISGLNVTVPFKKSIIPYLEELSPEAEITQSVNTVCLDEEKIVGHNTDIEGFELSIQNTKCGSSC